ncbi:ABC transporter substrate-binding protein [Occultella gossypii]|uniref:Extracellular solute-binding protein n=1 Tax=Occultella gossypii TaxID=2800820 RepID=A0ABS7S762_9MICO|nr:extracellular solute-binding protein [Occultella gossypii]MBZ2196185.1 extracellular solute-binding protein [Occultella gossypii]
MLNPLNPNPPLSRRSFLGTAAAGALLTTAGCAGFGGGGSGSESDGDASLTVTWWGDASRTELYDAALALFEADHEGVTTRSEFADLGPYLERMATAAAAGNLADVLWMRDTHVGRYGAGGSLLDLSEYLDDVIDVSAIGDAGIASGTVGDGVFALPTHYVGQALITAEDVLGAAGVSGGDIATWDDLAAAAREAADPSAGVFGINDPTLDDTHRHLEAWIRQAGGELFTPEGTLAADPAAIEEWFVFWKTLRDEGVLPPADSQSEANGAGWSGDFLVLGTSAMRLSSTNHFTIVSGLTEAPLGLFSTPALADATDDWWFFPPILISAAANTDSPEVAAALIDFFINDAAAADVTRLNQGAPSSSEIRDGLTPDLEGAETAFIEQISREMEQPARPFPIRPEGSEQFNGALTRIGEEIAYGGATVSEAVARLVSDAAGYLTAE